MENIKKYDKYKSLYSEGKETPKDPFKEAKEKLLKIKDSLKEEDSVEVINDAIDSVGEIITDVIDSVGVSQASSVVDSLMNTVDDLEAEKDMQEYESYESEFEEAEDEEDEDDQEEMEEEAMDSEDDYNVEDEDEE